MRKGSRVAVCRFTTHPIGGEVRLEIDGEMLRTGAEREWRPLLILATDWKQQFQEKAGRNHLLVALDTLLPESTEEAGRDHRF